jgi:hypothetical protein
MEGLRRLVGTKPVVQLPVLHAERLRESAVERLVEIFASRSLVHDTRDVEVPVVVEPVSARCVASTCRTPSLLTRPVRSRQIHAAPCRDHLTDGDRSFHRRKRRPFIDREVGERRIEFDFAPCDSRAVEAADQALSHRVRFELPQHIAAGEDHAPAKHRHHGAGFQTVGARADGPQRLPIEARLPDIGVLQPRRARTDSRGSRSRRDLRRRRMGRRARHDGKED